MDLQERRELNNGFGDTLAKAFELVLTPMIFGFLGFLLDRAIHTRPIFMLVFFLWAFGYVMWKAFSGYSATMNDLDRRRRAGQAPPEVDPNG